MSHGLRYPSRSRIIWWGAPPTKDLGYAFKTRDLSVDLLADESELPQDLSTVCAIVISDTEERPRFSAKLGHVTRDHLDHGVGIFGVATKASFQRFRTAAKDWHTRLCLQWEPHRILIDRGLPHELVHQIASRDAGPGAKSDLSIIGKIRTGDSVLLQRAFRDCSEIRLEKLAGGKSADAYLAHATLIQSETGNRPQPFFVKLDRRGNINIEKRNYETSVLGFIPFVNRPNLADGRCLTGASRGVLVGTFVDRTERFADVVLRGDGAALLNSLFDEALRGWRQQAFDAPSHAQTARSPSISVMAAIDQAFGGTSVDLKIPEARVALAVQLGARSPTKIVEALRSLGPTVFRRGPIHGDLHIGNVCAFRGSAILIDFYSARPGPLACDPAALEASLLTNAAVFPTTTESQESARAEWTALVTRLFSPEFLRSPPPPESAYSPLERIWNCVRHIRMHALAAVCGPSEYQVALAVYLLRAARYPAPTQDEDFRRAFAIVLADRLVAQLVTQ